MERLEGSQPTNPEERDRTVLVPEAYPVPSENETNTEDYEAVDPTPPDEPVATESEQQTEFETYKEAWKRLHLDTFYRRESSVCNRLWTFKNAPNSRHVLSDESTLEDLVHSIPEEAHDVVRSYQLECERLSRDRSIPYEQRDQKERELYDELVSHSLLESLVNAPTLDNVEDKKKVLDMIFGIGNLLKNLEKSLGEFFDECGEEEIGNLDRKSNELSPEALGKQLELRQKYIETVLKQLNMGNQEIAWAATVAARFPEEFLDSLSADMRFDKDSPAVRLFGITQEGLGHYSEAQITLAALYLAPDHSTHELISKLYHVFNRAFSEENLQSVPAVHSRAPSQLRDNPVRVALLKSIHDGTLQLWQGRTVFEVGGDGAVRALENLGAQSLESANAGHSYATGNMVENESGLIHLGNYQRYGQPHSADMICSAQLFDSGSGIAAIADTPDKFRADDYGKEEMLLLMSNLLKADGFMIHDAFPPDELMDAVGIKQVKRLSFKDLPGNSNATIYRPVEQPSINERTMGRKRVVYSQESATWELQGS